jgi:hypothetical protein
MAIVITPIAGAGMTASITPPRISPTTAGMMIESELKKRLRRTTP